MFIKKCSVICLVGLLLTIFVGCNFKDKEITLSKDVSKQVKQQDKEVNESIELGNSYLHQQKYDEALKAYEKAISKDPSNNLNYLKIKDKYIQKSRFDDAYYIVRLAIDNKVDTKNMNNILEEIKKNFQVINIENKVLENTSYKLPEKLQVTVNDKQVEGNIKWNTSNVSTKNPGIFMFDGTIDKYGRTVQLKLIVKEKTKNNGGLYVSYDGNVYYRKYTSENYSSDGIFAKYGTIPGSHKNMMYIGKDGISKVAFSDTGEGNIYIYNDKIYIEEYKDNYTTSIYSVDLDGKNKQEIGNGSIKAIDEDKGILVCVLLNENNNYELYKYDCVTGIKSKYNLSVPYADFLSLKDGILYYSGGVNFNDSKSGKVKLCSVNTDGTNQKLIAETDTDLYENSYSMTVIPFIQVVGDTIYFSYGTYGGTANIYQGGKIAKVSKDGSGFKVLVGNEKSSDGTNILAGDRFYVTNNTLYYLEGIEDLASRALNLTTGDKKIVDFNVNAEGKAFEDGNSVKIYLNQSDKATILIPNVDYSKLGLDLNAYKYSVYDVQQCGDWVYYKIEANQENPNANIGWRTGYHRVKTAVIRRNVNTNNEEVLFQY